MDRKGYSAGADTGARAPPPPPPPTPPSGRRAKELRGRHEEEERGLLFLCHSQCQAANRALTGDGASMPPYNYKGEVSERENNDRKCMWRRGLDRRRRDIHPYREGRGMMQACVQVGNCARGRTLTHNYTHAHTRERRQRNTRTPIIFTAQTSLGQNPCRFVVNCNGTCWKLFCYQTFYKFAFFFSLSCKRGCIFKSFCPPELMSAL